VVVTRSMLDASRFDAVGARIVRDSDAALLRDAALVIVDVRHAPAGWEQVLESAHRPWVALISHVDDAAREGALQLGARRVVTRSWLLGGDVAARIAELLASQVEQP